MYILADTLYIGALSALDFIAAKWYYLTYIFNVYINVVFKV